MDVKDKKFFFNGQPFSGEAAFICGYNGYTFSENHGKLCALIPEDRGVRSCWDKDGHPNFLLDENGDTITDSRRGIDRVYVEISNGNFVQFKH
jgi:hypothetical protein